MTLFLRTIMMCAIALLAGSGAALAADKSYPIDHLVGKADAPITIIEYFSLDCPHCARFEAGVMPEVQKNWIDTGKAKLILRDFPLHPAAQVTALVAQCSGARYLPFVDVFFKTQDKWALSDNPLPIIKGLARLGGMTEADFQSCINNAGLLKQITDRADEGQKLYNIDSTPSFLINGKLAVGEQSYDDFSKLLSAAR